MERTPDKSRHCRVYRFSNGEPGAQRSLVRAAAGASSLMIGAHAHATARPPPPPGSTHDARGRGSPSWRRSPSACTSDTAAAGQHRTWGEGPIGSSLRGTFRLLKRRRLEGGRDVWHDGGQRVTNPGLKIHLV